MAMHWTEFPDRVELFGDLISILETLDRDNIDDSFTGSCFKKRSESSAYTVELNPTGYRFIPRPERMPGLDRLLDRLEREGPHELTISAVRDYRGRVAAATNGTRATVDAMTIVQVADALDAAERPTPPPTPAPASAIATFQDFMWSVKAVEDAAGEMRAEAEAMAGAPGTTHYRLQAALWEAEAEYKKHPAFPFLEAYVNQRYGPFTHANLLRVRGDVCFARGCGSTEANQLSPDEVVKIIGCPGAIPLAVPPMHPERGGKVNSADEYTLEDVRGLLRYRRARAEFDAKYSAMVTRQGATMSVPDALHLTYWSAANTPQCGRLTEEAAVSVPLYHWLVVSARSQYQSELNEEMLLLLVGGVGIKAKREVTDLMRMTVSEFDTIRNAVSTALPQAVPPEDRGADDAQPAGSQPAPAPLVVVGVADSKVDPAVAHPPATAESTGRKKLTERQKLILIEMLAIGAVGYTKKTTRTAVVQRIDKSKTAADFARDFGVVKDAKFTNSEVGPEGGVWLTGAGKAKANELNAEDRG